MRNLLKLVAAIVITGSQSAAAQSWTMPTFNVTNDTIIKTGTACTFDNNGNTYWAGTYQSLLDPLAEGIYLWKVNAAGTVTRKLAIPRGFGTWNLNRVVLMQVINGALYVSTSGTYVATPFDTDVLLAKYNLNLVKQWDHYYNGPGSPDDNAAKVMAGPNNSILLLINTNGNSVVEKISPSTGATLNTITFDLSANETSVNMLVNNSFVYIAGTSALSTSSSIFISRFTNNLVQDWYITWDASGAGRPSQLSSMIMDNTGNIFLGGSFQTSSGSNRSFFAKYNKINGNRLWVNRPTNSGVFVAGLRTDGAQNLMAFLSSTADQRFMKLNGTTGAIIQNKITINAHPDLTYSARAFRAGAGNNFYILADYDSFYNSGSSWQLGATITRFNGSGTRIDDSYLTTWRADLNIQPVTIETTPDDRALYITNNADVTLGPLENYAEIGVIDYQPAPRLSQAKGEDSGILVYPQPARDQVTIDLAAAEIHPTTISIFNAQGQLTDVLTIAESQRLIQIDLSHYKSGMYFISCTDSDQIFTAKFLKE